jgi:hypothetical protein
LIDHETVSGNSIFRLPARQGSTTAAKPQAPALTRKNRPDVVIVMQFEALWLGWEGDLLAAPT